MNHRFQKGVLFSFNYTLGKAMGTSSTDLPAGNNNPNSSVLGFPRNDGNNAQANYMPLGFDRRHSIITTFVWQLPGPQRTDFIGRQANDWQISGVYRLVSGDPYTPTFSIPGISAYTMTGTQGLEGARLLSVQKTVRFPGHTRLELRVDAFNVMNHTQFWQVNSVLTVKSLADPTPANLPYDANGNLVNKSGFDTVSSTRDPRQVQLMARFYFS